MLASPRQEDAVPTQFLVAEPSKADNNCDVLPDPMLKQGSDEQTAKEFAQILVQLHTFAVQQTDVQRSLARIEGLLQREPSGQGYVDVQSVLDRIETFFKKQPEIPERTNDESTLAWNDMHLHKQPEFQRQVDAQSTLTQIEEVVLQGQAHAQSTLTLIEKVLLKQPGVAHGQTDTQNMRSQQSDVLQRQTIQSLGASSPKTKTPTPSSQLSGDNLSALPLSRSSAGRLPSVEKVISPAKQRKSRRTISFARTSQAAQNPFLLERASQVQVQAQCLPLVSKDDLKHFEQLQKSSTETSSGSTPRKSIYSVSSDGRQLAADVSEHEEGNAGRRNHSRCLSDAREDRPPEGQMKQHCSRADDGGIASREIGHSFAVHQVWSSVKTQNHLTSVLIKEGATGNLIDPGCDALSVREPMSLRTTHTATGTLDLRRVFVLSPASWTRLAWDLASAVMMAYEAIITPFMLAFRPPASTLTYTARVISLIFWSIDVLLSFMTGYYSSGSLVLHHKLIASRYLRTWFILDFFVISLDFIAICLDAQETAGPGFGRVLKIVRGVRTLRLLRLLKIKRILSQMYDKINSELLHVFITVMVKLITLLCLTHFVACGWFLVGSYGTVTSWVLRFVHEKPLHYQYTTSVHWAISQVHGSMEVSPTNTLERIFAIFVILVALVYFSVFLAHLASILGELVQRRSAQAHEFWLLRRYLKQMSISASCSARILKYLEYVVEKNQKAVNEESISMLRFLSKPLHDELKLEIYAGHLSKHIFFDFLRSCMRHCLTTTVDAFATCLMSAGDVVFRYGEHAENMLFLTDGICDYCFTGTSSQELSRNKSRSKYQAAGSNAGGMYVTVGDSATDGEFKNVAEGEWVCEAALWVAGWAHLGDLVAHSMSQLLSIDAEALRNEAQTNGNVAETMRAWAVCFVKHLNTIEASSLTDLLHLVLDPQEIFADMGLKFGNRSSDYQHATSLFMSLFRRPWSGRLGGGRRKSVFGRVCPSE